MIGSAPVGEGAPGGPAGPGRASSPASADAPTHAPAAAVAAPDATNASATGAYDRLCAAIAGEPLPCALVDLDAFDRNLERTLVPVRALGKTVRIATKSLRCVDLIRRALERSAGAARGLLCYAAREAAWLAELGFDDLLVAYPTVQPTDLAPLARAAAAGKRVSLVVDSVAHLDPLAAARRALGAAPAAVIELDVSYRPLGGLAHLGARRSPVRTPAAAVALARAARDRGIEVAGLMAYEAHIAGIPDRGPGLPAWGPLVRLLKRLARPAAARLRGAAVAALRADGFALPLVNGGGTGSLASTAADPAVTEVAAGSGLLAPRLFDGYDGLALEPAALLALQVVRASDPGLVTCFGGGYVASGAAGPDRLPQPWLPRGLRLLPAEGAGEVQTPLDVRGSERALQVGEAVFFRHAKAGEPCERFAELVLVRGAAAAGRALTYRGAAKAFG